MSRSQLDQHLEAERDQFREIAAQTQDFVGTADAGGRVHWLNEAARRMVGLAPDAGLAGVTLADLHPPDDVARFRSLVFPAVAGGGAWRGTGFVRPLDGRPDVPVSVMVIGHRPDAAGRQLYSAVFRDVTAEEEGRAALADRTTKLDLALSVGGVGAGILDLATLACDLDGRFREMLGLPADGPLHAHDLVARLTPEDGAMVLRRIGEMREGDTPGEGAISITAKVPGRGERRFEFEAQVYERDADGQPSKLIGVLRDDTDAWRTEQGLRLLNKELRHRVKNLFSVVGGLVAIGARGEADVPTFAAKLRERLDALGRAQSVATATEEFGPVRLDELVATLLRPYDRIVFEAPGEAISVPRQAVTPLSLVLHEMATNAVKHGQLGCGGYVHVMWRWEGQGVMLSWDEGDAAQGADTQTPEPLRAAPDESSGETGGGFGTVLIDQSVRQLGGTVERREGPGGLSAVFRFPALRETPPSADLS